MEFKVDLLEEIKKLLRQSGVQPVKKWLKSPEVRKLLSISPGTLQNLRINGTLSYSKVGGAMYYDLEEIEQLLTSNKIRK